MKLTTQYPTYEDAIRALEQALKRNQSLSVELNNVRHRRDALKTRIAAMHAGPKGKAR